MKLVSGILCALLASMLMAAIPFSPRPMKQSPGEIAFNAELDKTGAATNRVLLAKSYLERYPNDVSLGQTAADVFLDSGMSKGDAVDYMAKFAEGHPREFAPQYAYAYVADDSTLWGEQAQRALAKDSTNFWAWLMWANAEWRRANPDLDTVAARLEKAVTLDPSRPEAYLSLGDAYMEQGDWLAAVDAYRAGRVCDPSSNIFRLRLEDANDRVRRATPKSDKSN